MGTRNTGKKSEGVQGTDGPPPRLLRPRGVCYRCHFPTPSSCVCPGSTSIEVKVRIPSSLVSPESASATVNLAPAAVRKKRLPYEDDDALPTRSKSPASRRQLFRETTTSSCLDVSESTSSIEHALSEAAETSSSSSSSEHSCESTSSQPVEEDSVLPSTSSGPVPSTSTAETQFSKSKRRKKKLKTLGRHVCPICSKMFGSPGKLNQHMFSHTGEKPFECDKCMKAFSSKFKLVRHLLIHSDERQYRCPMCDRTFHRKDHLKNHLKVHSPVKKTYRCDKMGCMKVYSSLLSYRKHAAVHAAEEGDLDCKMCGKSFATKDEIVYHLKVHAGSRTVKNPSDKKYGCDHCDRRFFTRKDVRRHLVVHTGKRDFLCQFCPHRFGRKDHLVRHIKKSHSNVSSGLKVGASKGKRSRLGGVLESSQPAAVGAGRQRTVLRTHGRLKTTVSLESPNEIGGLTYPEPANSEFLPNVMAGISIDIKSLKQERSDPSLEVEELMVSQNETSFDEVKEEDCPLLPDLQPIMFPAPTSHSPFVEHLPVDNMSVPPDEVGGSVKSEESLSSLSVGIDMNQFISGYLVSSAVSTTESNAIQDEQSAPEPPVPANPPATTGISDAEASEFLAHFSNDDEIMQFMALSIPISSAPTPSSSTDMVSPTAPLGPLPRFQQAFQQQPP